MAEPATPTITSNDKILDLFHAVRSGDKEKVAKMVKTWADASLVWPKLDDGFHIETGRTLLMEAMRHGKAEIVDLLLEKGARTAMVDQYGKTAGMQAVEAGQGKLLLKRINTGTSGRISAVSNLNQKDTWEHTIMHYVALRSNHQDLIEELLSSTDKDVVGVDEAYEMSMQQGAFDTAAKMLKAGSKEDDGDTISSQGKRILERQRTGENLNKGSSGRISLGAAAASEELAGRKRESSPVRPGSKVGFRSESPGPEGKEVLSQALRLACKRGQYTEALGDVLEAHSKELNLTDEDGLTPLMIALSEGHERLATELVRMNVNVDAASIVMVGPEGKKMEEKFSVLSLSLKYLADPAPFVKLLVSRRVTVGLPQMTTRMSVAESREMVLKADNPVGYLLGEARRGRDGLNAKAIYSLARMLLAPAFVEAPGDALCSAVVIALEMIKHSNEQRLIDITEAEELEDESVEVGKSVGALIQTLPEIEQERLLYSPEGANFLLLAAAANRRKMLSAPSVQRHLSRRWYGDTLGVIFRGEAKFQWGGVITVDALHKAKMIAFCLGVVLPLNMIALPLIALVPPLRSVIVRFLHSLGKQGVDPRYAGLEISNLGLGSWSADGTSPSGYSPSLMLWYRSLLLDDVPCVKYFVTQLSSILLVSALLIAGPCYDFDGVENCFGALNYTHAQMIGAGEDELIDDLLEDLHIPDLHLDELINATVEEIADDDEVEAEADYVRRRMAAQAWNGASYVATTARRMLKRAKRLPGGGGGEERGSNTASEDELPFHAIFNFSKDMMYIFLVVYLFCSLLTGSLKGRDSLSASSTYATTLGCVCALGFFICDLSLMYTLDTRYDLQPLLLSAGAMLISLDVGRALMLQTFTCGPLVLMLIQMLKDLVVWLMLALVFVVAFALSIFLNVSIRGELVEVYQTCALPAEGFSGYFLLLLRVLLGMDNMILCFEELGDTTTVVLMQIYLLAATILLINVLIAMMAKTFDTIRDEQELNYSYTFSCIVVTVDLQDADVPPPLNLLRGPSVVVGGFLSLLRSICAPLGYTRMADEGGAGEGGEPDHKKFHFPYTHKKPEEILTGLLAIDCESEDHDMIYQINLVKENQEKMMKNQETIKDHVGAETEGSSGEDESDVKIYDGFKEEACRLVFPYGDKFPELEHKPVLVSINRFGEIVNKPKPLPHRSDQLEGGGNLKEHALLAFVRPGTLPDALMGKRLVNMHGDTYVHERANKTFGVCHTWDGIYNAKFQEFFECSTENPKPEMFKAQAVYEFERTVQKLFGEDATQRVPIVFAKNSADNENFVLMGKAEALEAFLAAHPEVLDELRIAKLFPGGFISAVTTRVGGADSKQLKFENFEHFHFTPQKMYALYTKKGFKEMACLKAMAQFMDECTLGQQITRKQLAEKTKARRIRRKSVVGATEGALRHGTLPSTPLRSVTGLGSFTGVADSDASQPPGLPVPAPALLPADPRLNA